MIIAGVETFVRGSVGLCRVRTQDGAEGWGQMAPFDADISALFLHRHLAPALLGRNADAVDAISTDLYDSHYKFRGTFLCRALCGIDTALWDLRARRAGVPVCVLAGGEPRAIPVYASSMRRDTTPEDEVTRLEAVRDSLGINAFKFKIGRRAGRDSDEWPGRTESLVALARRRLGDSAHLKADANGCYSPQKAIAVGRLLEDHGIEHFEEPCPYWEIEWTAEVAAALAVPVAGGEQDNCLAQFRRMLAMHAVDILQCDVGYVGGFTRALQVAALAQAHGLKLMPHSANHSLLHVFSRHLMAAIPNAASALEFSIEENAWAHALYSPTPRVRDGQVGFPDEPGWGVRISRDWLEHAERTETKK